VIGARRHQTDRFAFDGISFNAAMDAALTHSRISVTPEVAASAEALERLSGRGQDRVLRLARTIADLAGTERVELDHLDEAVGYRMSDPLQAVA
jgi:magnesium chelatase family protein